MTRRCSGWLLFTTLSILFSACCFAKPSQAIPQEVKRLQLKKLYQPLQQENVFLPQAGQKQKTHSVVIKSPLPAVFTLKAGSLRENIQHIAQQFGWHTVIWKAPYDYNWTGDTAISANSLTQLLKQILQDYPLQAVFYKGNHILVVQPRNIK